MALEVDQSPNTYKGEYRRMSLPRLLSLNSYHYRRGGADMVYFEHDALFRHAGWETAFFSMHHPMNLASEWDGFFVDELQYGHDYGLAEKMAMVGKIIYSTEARRKLSALLDVFRPDVAHSHNLYHHISPSVLPLLRERGIPSVLTAHDLKLACPSHTMLARDGICERCKNGNFLHAIAQRCVKNSLSISGLVATESWLHRVSGIYRRNLDRIIVPSRFYKKKFVEWGWPEEIFEYVPNFVDIRDFAPVFAPGRYVVYFGRMSYEKGVGTLLAAAEASGVEVVFIGDGELSDTVRDAAERVDNIQYVGRKTGAELSALVSAARAVVLPSEWYENAPMSLLEGFALGKPAVGADIGGIPEMIRDGETGLLFESGQVSALAAALQKIATMSDVQVEAMGRHARDVVHRDFSRDRYRDRILDVYRSLGVKG